MDNYLRILGRFLEQAGLQPLDLVRMDDKLNDDMLDDFISGMLEKGRTGATCVVYKKVVASWLGFHGASLKRTIKIPDQHVSTRAVGDRAASHLSAPPGTGCPPRRP